MTAKSAALQRRTKLVRAAMKNERAAWEKYKEALKRRTAFIRKGELMEAAKIKLVSLHGEWFFHSNMVLWHLHRASKGKK